MIGAAIEVHRALGPGFMEAAYGRALLIELRARGVTVRSEVGIPVVYRGVPVAEGRIDLLVEETVVVELKAVERILPVHRAQLLSYLKAGSFPVGLLINFNVALLRDGIHRLLL